jgi:APA family basic amino acid/polyamine antiporter
MSDGYRRQVGPFSATMLIAGSMVGSGVFLVGADIVRTGRGAGFLMAAWALVTVLTVAAALSYGELAAAYPRAGGQYTYLREVYGPLPGFLYGWTAFTVIECGGLAAVGVGFGQYLGAFLPWVSDQRWLVGPLQVAGLRIGSLEVGPYALGLTTARAAGITLILAFTLLNAFGVRLGTRVQNLFTLAKLGSLAALIMLGLTLTPHVPPEPGPYLPADGSPALPFLTALLVVQTGCLFSAVGWEYVTNIAAEVVEPERTIPRALLVGTLLVCGLYLLVNALFLKILGPTGIATAKDDRVGSAALQALLGPTGGLMMAGAILVSMAGWMNGAVLSTARVYQTMAGDGLFFASAARLNGHGVPAASMGIQALWASLLALTGSYGQLLDFSIFAALLFYVVVVAAVFVSRWKHPELPRPYKVFAYPLLPAMFLVAGLAILGTLLRFKPAFTWPGLFIVALGIPVYFTTRRSIHV